MQDVANDETKPRGQKAWATGDTLRLEGEVQSRVVAAIRGARPVVVVLNGAHVGGRHPLLTNAIFGRNPESDVVLTDAGVSWRHAAIEERSGKWYVVDFGSTNGTQVNGERIAERQIVAGDRVMFGATIVRFELVDEIEDQYGATVSKLINHDDLTGLLRKARFDVEVKTLFEAAKLRRAALSLVVMDLDGLKPVNDTYGHLAGESVIAAAGEIIRDIVGRRGLASRFGGDEFVAALPEHSLPQALVVAEEIRSRIAAHRFGDATNRYPITVSIGLAAAPDHGDDYKKVFTCGDEALYRAKQRGKNRVES